MGRDPEEPLTDTTAVGGADDGPGAPRTGPRRHPLTRFLPVLALLAVAAWRATIGLDLGDGTHVVGLGMRLAQGDLPLADEMNLQALGALPSVPFVWLWLHVVGTEGVILASRLIFVALAALAGWVSWRALRPMVGGAVAGAAVAAALVPAPYNIMAVSYNTSPGLLLLVATCAGARAVQDSSRPWAVGAGVAAALAALCNPVLAPAAGLTLVMVVLLSRRRPVVVGCAVGALAVAAVVVAWLVVVIGVENARATLEFTTAYQDQRRSYLSRLDSAWEFYGRTMTSPLVVVAAALGVLACVPRVPLRLRALVVAAVPVLLAWGALRETPADVSVPTTGMTTGVLALVLLLVLLPPASAWAVQQRGAARRARPAGDRTASLTTEPTDTPDAGSGVVHGLGPLLLIAVVPAVVQVPLVSALTSSSPQWGAVATAVVPALCAVLAATGSMARAASTRLWAVAAVTSTCVLLAAHTIQPFRDPAPWHLTERVSHGAAAGVLTSALRKQEVDQVTRAVASCQRPGDGLLAYGVPAAYAFGDGPMDTNILWLGAFRSANEAGVRWIERTGREPECVLISRSYLEMAGPDPESRRRNDPLLRWVEPRYRVVAQPDNGYVVLRRKGS